jgi:ribosome-binding factor A
MLHNLSSAAPSYKRADRVADRIRAELAEILVRDVHDPRIGRVTIMRVFVTDDLRTARIFVKTEAGKNMVGLKKATGFIRSTLAKRMELRIVPDLHFLPDTGTDPAVRLLDLLDEVSGQIDEQDREQAAGEDKVPR